MYSSKNQQNKHVLSKIGLTILITLGAQSLQAEVTETQQAVLDHYATMKEMSGTERKNYRKELFSGMSRAEQRSFQKAFKEVRAMIPNHLNIEDVSNTNKKSTNHHKSPAVRAPGTSITYDTGTVFGTAGINSQMVGNRFDSALNSAGTMCCTPVETSGSITMITFDMVNTFFSSAVWSLYSNISGTMANQVTSMAISGIGTGINTISIMSPTTANAYMNGTFLAGIWQFDPTMTALAVDTGSTGGQGFHAISLNDGAAGTMLTTVTSGGMGLNAIFRVAGNVLPETVPVELIDFTIEKDSE